MTASAAIHGWLTNMRRYAGSTPSLAWLIAPRLNTSKAATACGPKGRLHSCIAVWIGQCKETRRLHKLAAEIKRGEDDIRPPHAEEMTIEERDEAMVSKTMELLGAATNILVICGESHRAGVEKRLKGHGLKVESLCYR